MAGGAQRSRASRRSHIATATAAAASSIERIFADGAAFQRTGRLLDALKCYRAVLEVEPHRLDALCAAGVAAFDAGHSELAVEWLRRATSRHSSSVVAWTHLGLVLEAMGDAASAADAFARAAVLAPGDVRIRQRLAETAMRCSRWPLAVDAYRAVLAAGNRTAAGYNALGNALRASGDPHAALEAFGDAIAADPQVAGGWLNRGLVLKELGRLGEAIADYRHAIELAPAFVAAYSNLAVALTAAGAPEEAAAVCRQALDLEPDSAHAWTNLGVALVAMGDYAAAVRAQTEAVARAPDRASAYVGLVDSNVRLGDLEGALSWADAWLARKPDDTAGLALRSVVLQERRDFPALRRLVDFDRYLMADWLEPAAPFGCVKSMNSALVEAVLAHPTLVESPTTHATRQGMHTGELLDGESEVFAAWESSLRRSIERCIAALPDDPEHPFPRSRPARWRLTAWSVVMRGQGHQIPHIHPAAWMSGVYYPLVPDIVSEARDDRPGWIEFGRPGTEVHWTVEPPVRLLQPEEGRVFFFPSYCFHRTIPFKSDQTRISIAFDLVPQS